MTTVAKSAGLICFLLVIGDNDSCLGSKKADTDANQTARGGMLVSLEAERQLWRRFPASISIVAAETLTGPIDGRSLPARGCLRHAKRNVNRAGIVFLVPLT